MADVLILEFSGVTVAEYRAVNRALGIDVSTGAGEWPDGLLFHASGPVDGGWGVIDFWESRAHFDTFAAERIGPAMASLGVPGGPPDIHEFPVHEHFPR